MKLKSHWTLSFVDIATAAFSCIAYHFALFSTAIGGFWTGPDFDHAPMSGWECLLTGWFEFPIGWLANPVLFAATVLLLFRLRIAAFLLGVGAVGFSTLWVNQFFRQFPPKLLLSGYDWWLLSQHILVAGSFCSLIVHYPETWQSMRLLCRASRVPAPEIQTPE